MRIWEQSMFSFHLSALKDIEIAFAKIEVHGGRMNEMQMQIVDQT